MGLFRRRLPTSDIVLSAGQDVLPGAVAASPSRLAGFMGRVQNFAREFLEPERPLGRLGAYIGAASGSPVGLASIEAMRNAEARSREEAENRLKERQLEIMANRNDRQINVDSGWQVMLDRTGRVIRANRYTGQIETLAEPAAGTISEPLVATESGYLPRSQAVGRMPYRAPQRAVAGRGDGRESAGLTPNQRAAILAEAAKARAAGVPEDAIRARLAELGVR